MTPADLTLYTVYDHPRDYPNSVVVRRWAVGGAAPTPEAGAPYLIGPSLVAIREALLQLHPDLTCISREDGDDPVIVETWV